MKGFAHSYRKHHRQILTMTLAFKVGINRKIELEGCYHWLKLNDLTWTLQRMCVFLVLFWVGGVGVQQLKQWPPLINTDIYVSHEHLCVKACPWKHAHEKKKKEHTPYTSCKFKFDWTRTHAISSSFLRPHMVSKTKKANFWHSWLDIHHYSKSINMQAQQCHPEKKEKKKKKKKKELNQPKYNNNKTNNMQLFTKKHLQFLLHKHACMHTYTHTHDAYTHCQKVFWVQLWQVIALSLTHPTTTLSTTQATQTAITAWRSFCCGTGCVFAVSWWICTWKWPVQQMWHPTT